MYNANIYSAIDDNYKVNSLKDLYDYYLYEFDIERNGQRLKKAELSKVYLTELLIDIFSLEYNFLKLLEILPEKVRKVFELLIWEPGEVDVRIIEKQLNCKILKDEDYNGVDLYKNIKIEFFIFAIKYEYNFHGKHFYSLYLPKEVKTLLKRYFPTPDKFKLKPVVQLENILHIEENNDSILKDISLYIKYFNNQPVSVSAQKRPLKGSLKTVREYCGIKEFFPNAKGTECEYLKTELVINFLKSFYLREIDKSPAKYLKDMFYDYQLGEDFYSFNLLYHIKNLKKTVEYSLKPYNVLNSIFNTSVFHLIQNLAKENWYSFENVFNFAVYKDYDLNLINENEAYASLYFNFKSKYGDTKEYIQSETLYREVVIIPALKGTFFLLSAFGILDIAYDWPKNSLKSGDSDYLSVFDGLKYIKLTKFGAYICGIDKTYVEEKVKDDTELILDENELLINLYGDNKLKGMFIKKFASQLTETVYKMDYVSFLQECHSQVDIKTKIILFAKEISDNPPQIWKDFFQEVINKSKPLEKSSDLIIYKLKDDKELIDLLLRDEILQRHILKVENKQIAIDKKDISKVRKRLEQFGYMGSII